MAIVYCCWTTGDDTTGDGSYGTPYKTITKASTGLTGGDEVRVSKSAAHTALSGTLTWTYNSTSVTTSADLTGELTANLSLIGKDADDGMWYEISAVTSTTITLRYTYCGTSATTAGYRMEFHDYGSPTISQQLQVVSASGSSASSRLKISGGWDLSSQQQTGWSFFCSTSATQRYGLHLCNSGKSFLEIEKIVCARGYSGFFASGAYSYVDYTNCESYSASNISFNLGSQSNITLTTVKAATFVTNTTLSATGSGLVLDDVVLHTSSTSGYVNATFGHSTHIKKLTVLCAGYGMQISGSETRIDELILKHSGRGLIIITGEAFGPQYIKSLTFIGHTSGMRFNNGLQLIIGKLTESDNTNYIESISALNNLSRPLIMVQRWNDVAGDSRALYAFGTVYRDTTDARSGACIKATPTNATYYMEVSLGKHRVTSVAADIVLSVYAKDDATFNGDVDLMAKMNQSVVNEWTAKVMDTSYGQHSLTVDTLDLVNGEWLELVARVRGTAGSVFFDDFAAA